MIVTTQPYGVKCGRYYVIERKIYGQSCCFPLSETFFFEYKTRNIIHRQSIASRIGRSKKMEKCFYLFTTLPFTGKCAIFDLATGRYVTSESFFFFVGRYERDEKTDDRYIPISLILFAMSHSLSCCERSIIGRTPSAGAQTQVQRPPLERLRDPFQLPNNEQKSHQTLQCSMKFDS